MARTPKSDCPMAVVPSSRTSDSRDAVFIPTSLTAVSGALLRAYLSLTNFVVAPVTAPTTT